MSKVFDRDEEERKQINKQILGKISLWVWFTGTWSQKDGNLS